MITGKIIGIRFGLVHTPFDVFAEKEILKVMPYIIYKVDNSPIETIYFNKPFEIITQNTSLLHLKNYIKNKDDIDILNFPNNIYNNIVNAINSSACKTQADIAMMKIVEELKSSEIDGKTNFVFFDSPNNNKIIGRMAYLHLNNQDNNFCFVYYKAKDLYTNITSNDRKMKLDINYFSGYRIEDNVSKPYPNDTIESLTQTEFFNMSKGQTNHLPLRIDIFTQGISNVREKENQLSEFLKNDKNISGPIQDKSSNRILRIPKILEDLISFDNLKNNSSMTDILSNFD